MDDRKLLVGIQEKPASIGQWIILSLQHVFAMFGATVLVPIITGLDIGVALVASGIGTLIYIASTKGKVPVYLGSSFAYISTIGVAAAATDGFESVYVGLMVVGLIYMAIAFIIYFVGSSWIKKLLPPVVIGPMIIIIGMSLAPVAISNIGLDGGSFDNYSARQLNSIDYASADVTDYLIGDNILYLNDDMTAIYNYKVLGSVELSLVDGDRVLAYSSNPLLTEGLSLSLYEYQDGTLSEVSPFGGYAIILVAVITFASVVLFSLIGKGFIKIVPFLLAIIVGYLASMIFGIVDYSVFASAKFFQLPNFSFIGTYKLDFSQVLVFAPLAFVTIAEHIGDHVVLGEITGNDFITEPGLNKTILGDGLATFVSASLGGPANTTYGENTGVVAITRVGSVWVIGLAAIFAIFLGFFGYIQAFISSIPWAVIGGMTVILYGLIASNGVKVLIKDHTDLGNMRNLIIVSTMLVLGLGGATIQISANAALSGMSLAAIVGILLNLGLTALEKYQTKKV